METRARYPLARGQPNCLARRVSGKRELVLERVEGRALARCLAASGCLKRTRKLLGIQQPKAEVCLHSE